MNLVLVALLALGADPSTPPVYPAKPRLICREGEQVTGSHMRTGRRCLTQEQWDEEYERLSRAPVTMRITAHQPDASEPATRPQ